MHKITLVVGPTRVGKGVIALWPGSSSNPCQPKPPDRKVSKGKRKRSGATGVADVVVVRWRCGKNLRTSAPRRRVYHDPTNRTIRLILRRANRLSRDLYAQKVRAEFCTSRLDTRCNITKARWFNSPTCDAQTLRSHAPPSSRRRAHAQTLRSHAAKWIRPFGARFVEG